MDVDQRLIGERSQPVFREVERGSIRRFAQALGLTDAKYRDVEAAQALGYRDIVAPPTYAVTLLPWEIPGLQVPSAGVLHGEQSFEWEDSICAGDRLSVTGWVDTIKSRGALHIITIASEGINQMGNLAFRAQAVLIVTEETAHANRG